MVNLIASKVVNSQTLRLFTKLALKPLSCLSFVQQASGVKVCDEVKDVFNEMKVVKADSDPKERIRFVLMEIADGYIKIAKIYREKDVEGEDVYLFFVKLLKPKVCGYLLYDCHFTTTESGIKQELVFIMW